MQVGPSYLHSGYLNSNGGTNVDKSSAGLTAKNVYLTGKSTKGKHSSLEMYELISELLRVELLSYSHTILVISIATRGVRLTGVRKFWLIYS
jgi:hypothetical protein